MFISGDPVCGHNTPNRDSTRFPALQRNTENMGGRDVLWPIRTWRSLLILSLPLCKHCISHLVVSSKWIFAETTPKTVVITNNKRSCYNTDIGVLSVILSDRYRHDDIVHHWLRSYLDHIGAIQYFVWIFDWRNHFFPYCNFQPLRIDIIHGL